MCQITPSKDFVLNIVDVNKLSELLAFIKSAKHVMAKDEFSNDLFLIQLSKMMERDITWSKSDRADIIHGVIKQIDVSKTTI